MSEDKPSLIGRENGRESSHLVVCNNPEEVAELCLFFTKISLEI